MDHSTAESQQRHNCHSRLDRESRNRQNYDWIPASAGMTTFLLCVRQLTDGNVIFKILPKRDGMLYPSLVLRRNTEGETPMALVKDRLKP